MRKTVWSANTPNSLLTIVLPHSDANLEPEERSRLAEQGAALTAEAAVALAHEEPSK